MKALYLKDLGRGAFGIMKLKVKPQIKKIALLKKVVDRSVDYPLIDK